MRPFSHRFKREIVSVDVQSLQGSSQFPVLSSQLLVVRRCWFGSCLVPMLPSETLRFRIRASRFAIPQIPESDAPLGFAPGRAKYFYIFFLQHASFPLRISHNVPRLTSRP